MQKIIIETIVRKEKSEVYNAWISPRAIQEWCHASDDWGVGEVTNDVRVGGRFTTEMKALDGSFSFVFGGHYTAVLPEEKLTYQMDTETEGEVSRECQVTFEKVGESETLVKEEFDPETLNPREMQEAGWQAILENFKKYAESK